MGEARSRALEAAGTFIDAIASGAGGGPFRLPPEVWAGLPARLKGLWTARELAPSDLRELASRIVTLANRRPGTEPAAATDEAPLASDFPALMAKCPYRKCSTAAYGAMSLPPERSKHGHPSLSGAAIVAAHAEHCHCRTDPTRTCAGATLAALVAAFQPVDETRALARVQLRGPAVASDESRVPPLPPEMAAHLSAAIDAAAAVEYIIRGEPLINSPCMVVYRRSIRADLLPPGKRARIMFLRANATAAVAAIGSGRSRPLAEFTRLASGDLFKLKPRLVADCRRGPNDCVPEWPMRYETVSAIAAAMTPGCVMVTRDIKGAYQHIRLDEAARRFIGFYDHLGRGWVYDGAVMGIKSACAAFSAVSSFVVWLCRKEGLDSRVVIIPYIDDFTIIAPDAAAMSAALALFHAVCGRIGLSIDMSDPKNCEPACVIESLGVEFNSIDMTSGLSPVKRAQRAYDTFILARCIRESVPVPTSVLESYAGKIAHTATIYPQLRPLVRPLYAAVHKGSRYLHLWPPTDGGQGHSRLAAARGAILRLESTFESDELAAQRRLPSGPRLLVHMSSDASGTTAWGCRIGSDAYWGAWSADQLGKSIAYKELWPVLCMLQRFTAPDAAADRSWRDRVVHIATDNLPNVYNINSMAANGDAAELMDIIATVSAESGVFIVATWLPREANTFCDALSKCMSFPSAAALCRSERASCIDLSRVIRGAVSA
jgi:hypothetical protein